MIKTASKVLRVLILLAGLRVLMAPTAEAKTGWCPEPFITDACYLEHDNYPSDRVYYFQCHNWDWLGHCCYGACYVEHWEYIESVQEWWPMYMSVWYYQYNYCGCDGLGE
jgi:hypothetical protein